MNISEFLSYLTQEIWCDIDLFNGKIDNTTEISWIYQHFKSLLMILKDDQQAELYQLIQIRLITYEIECAYFLQVFDQDIWFNSQHFIHLFTYLLEVEKNKDSLNQWLITHQHSLYQQVKDLHGLPIFLFHIRYTQSCYLSYDLFISHGIIKSLLLAASNTVTQNPILYEIIFILCQDNDVINQYCFRFNTFIMHIVANQEISIIWQFIWLFWLHQNFFLKKIKKKKFF